MLTSASYETCTDFGKHGWSDVKSKCTIVRSIMVCKALHGLAVDYLVYMFIERIRITHYALKETSVTKLSLPRAHTDYLKYIYSYNGTILWKSHTGFSIQLRWILYSNLRRPVENLLKNLKF